MGNLVAIVGRPNVGKSTLFNRLTKSRQAIVSDEAGTTRDRQYGKCDWCGREFSVVDTGGWVVNSDDIFEEEIRKQVIIATEEADLVLFLCDIKNGVTDWDMDVAQILRRAKLPTLLVANKADDGTHRDHTWTPPRCRGRPHPCHHLLSMHKLSTTHPPGPWDRAAHKRKRGWALLGRA